ncbi:hypothetical protein CDD82_2319 [Ophiocordyceps australis]|uniref:protein-tyrosine-phosphatase n=1 Tax=Ophiocordyceps australis TaxID=1399860 RepID=A0A2C5ZCD5_9HYPO|nr:hypothetical protein CDD82_2319 [Ophiocordyceps australis]
MPSAAARRICQDQIPSFMSVFHLDPDTMADRETVTLVQPDLAQVEPKAPAIDASQQCADPPRKHTDSNLAQVSESSDSSPTTTLSTTDSSPLSDPSPSSSPDSPAKLIPLNKYPTTSFASRTTHGNMLSIPEAGSLERPMTSPSPRRPRNTKGLSIQPPGTLVDPSRTPSTTEPSSPSFIKPRIPAMRRKPSQLSLKTDTSDLVVKPSLEVPQSPAMAPILQRRALKHSMSSPHMMSGLKSCSFGPLNGMTFPKVLERNESGLSEMLRPMKSGVRAEFDTTARQEASPIKTQLASRGDYEPSNDSAQNEDHKSPGYPYGPVAIYGNNVFLYLEPTAEEASRYDVVINVAREVQNPFEAVEHKTRASGYSGIVDDQVSAVSLASAPEYLLCDSQTKDGSTGRITSLSIPEYIHMPWDHNTDIAPDLMRLCEIIDDRTTQGKKVLIHCQQGASRSASLIIAYGLYQRPELSVNDAYYAAQAKSRWISPNMKLMYSLQDFQKELSKKRLPATTAYGPRTGRSPTKHRLTLSADAANIATTEPHTAPLPGNALGTNANRTMRSPSRLRGGSKPAAQPISAGPASAPLSCPWRDSVGKEDDMPNAESSSDESLQHFNTGTQAVDPLKVPVKRLAKQASQAPVSFLPPGPSPMERKRTLAPSCTDEALMSPRAETMINNPLHTMSQVAGMRFAETPPTPTGGLFSPREPTFSRDPFSFFGRVSAFGRPPQVADPRSPPTKGEAPIYRSIDDIL